VTQVSTLPSGNYRQHQRNQADEPLALLALRALGIWRDSWLQAARRARGLGRFPGLGRATDAESGSREGGDIPVDRMQSRAWQLDSSFVTPRRRGMDSNFQFRDASTVISVGAFIRR
jgi:hypothetical protein